MSAGEPLPTIKINDGGNAFPDNVTDGMSLRDYFAAQALTGYICLFVDSKVPVEQTAKRCYEFADAMLAQRAKPSSDRNPVTHVNAGHGGEAPQ